MALSLQETFIDQAKRFNHGFEEYRKYGAHPVLRTSNRHLWADRSLPRPVSARVKFNNEPFTRQPCIGDDEPNIASRTRVGSQHAEARSAQIRLRAFRRWFSQNRDGTDFRAYSFQKVLGFGGHGVAAHYKYPLNHDGSQAGDYGNCAVKFAVQGWEDKRIPIEGNMTMKVRKSAHCIQLITPQERFISQLSNDDSSVDGESSGDEIAPNDRVDNANRKKEPPTAREIRARRRARGERRKEIDDMIKNMPPRRDLLVLEYMPNGDLFTLIQRLAKHRREHGALLGGIIPNRVLWSFWLCLIRACIAMEYPPRKFQQGESDLVETIPENVNRRQNLVHFDIDPSNVFIGDLELSKEGEESQKKTGEKDETTRRHLGRDLSIGLVRPIKLTARDRRPCGHEFVPKLKLADFGVADKIKLMKRNTYYLNRRLKGKPNMYAPEQFGHEWDNMPSVLDSRTIAHGQQEGFYGPHTNVWGIAWTMWMLITKLFPPNGPKPQIPESLQIDTDDQTPQEIDRDMKLFPLDDDRKISYCPLLLDKNTEFGWADLELRQTIYACMYHRPEHRPTLDNLLQQASTRIYSDDFINETDERIRSWIHEWINEPSPQDNPLSSFTDSEGGHPGFFPPFGLRSTGRGLPSFPPGIWRGAPDLEKIPPPLPYLEPITRITAFKSSFPHGAIHKSDDATKGPSGLISLIRSLDEQLGSKLVTSTNANLVSNTGALINMPTYDELLQRYRADGIIPALHQNAQGSQDGPYYSAEIHKVLRSWGDQYGLQLGLGVCTNNGDHRLVSPEESRIWTIWIYFDSENEGWRGVRPLFDGAPIPIPGPIQYTLRFPYGVNVASAGPGPPREDPLHSGIRAIIHSLRNQFFVNQAVSPNLTHDDVLISFQRWIRSRRNFAAAAASTYPSYTMPTPGPLTAPGIAGTLFTWGTRHGYNFDLGVISDDNAVPAYVLPSGAHEPQTIWVLQRGENSHDWRGLTRRGPPTPPNTGPPGSDDSLPDYESD